MLDVKVVGSVKMQREGKTAREKPMFKKLVWCVQLSHLYIHLQYLPVNKKKVFHLFVFIDFLSL